MIEGVIVRKIFGVSTIWQIEASVFLLIFVVFTGAAFVQKNEHSYSLWGPPLWIPYLFLPLGMTVLFLQYVVQIWGKIISLRRGEFSKEKERFELKDIDLPEADSGPKD